MNKTSYKLLSNSAIQIYLKSCKLNRNILKQDFYPGVIALINAYANEFWVKNIIIRHTRARGSHFLGKKEVAVRKKFPRSVNLEREKYTIAGEKSFDHVYRLQKGFCRYSSFNYK